MYGCMYLSCTSNMHTHHRSLDHPSSTLSNPGTDKVIRKKGLEPFSGGSLPRHAKDIYVKCYLLQVPPLSGRCAQTVIRAASSDLAEAKKKKKTKRDQKKKTENENLDGRLISLCGLMAPAHVHKYLFHTYIDSSMIQPSRRLNEARDIVSN